MVKIKHLPDITLFQNCKEGAKSNNNNLVGFNDLMTERRTFYEQPKCMRLVSLRQLHHKARYIELAAPLWWVEIQLVLCPKLKFWLCI